MKMRRRGLPKLAKIAIVAMLLADAAGLYLAHNKINRARAELTAGVSEEFVLAKPMSATPAIAPVALQPAPVALAAAAAIERPVDYPAIITLQPIKVELTSTMIERAAEARLAERAPTVPSVRLAAARPAKRQSHSFNAAFGREMQTHVPSVTFAPDMSLAKLAAESEPVLPAGAAYNADQMDAVPAASDPVATAAIEAPTAPAADTAVTPEAPSTAPAPSSSPAGELPPS